MEKNENGKSEKSKLTLDDFKLKSSILESKEALDAINGGILAACHDAPTGPIECHNYHGG
jgi:hypothetical protein